MSVPDYGIYDKRKQLHKNKKINPRKFTPADYKEYQNRIMAIGHCQLCGDSDISTPHHARFGAHKDDRTLMCICMVCHMDIHTNGDKVKQKMAEHFGEKNWREYGGDLREKYEDPSDKRG